jgi:hypothetical protein
VHIAQICTHHGQHLKSAEACGPWNASMSAMLEELHHLVDQLPEAELRPALEVIRVATYCCARPDRRSSCRNHGWRWPCATRAWPSHPGLTSTRGHYAPLPPVPVPGLPRFHPNGVMTSHQLRGLPGNKQAAERAADGLAVTIRRRHWTGGALLSRTGSSPVAGQHDGAAPFGTSPHRLPESLQSFSHCPNS